MAFDLITIAVFGHADPAVADKLRLRSPAPHEAGGFDVHARGDDSEVGRFLADVRPQVIFTFGPVSRYERLSAMPLDVRRRWVHYDDPTTDPAQLAEAALGAFVDLATNDRFPNQPLVSVFTPTYRTGDRLQRPFRSLLAQTYDNWEWVAYDDSPETETFDQLARLADGEPRIRAFRADRPCGIIGEVKRRACGLARGRILVELDHDDELTATCLSDVVAAFQAFPDAGFAYTDCAEVLDSGENVGYGDGYGFGFGTYRSETYRGHSYLVTNYPPINAKTVRHIVSMPNHVRAWRRDVYERIGGHGSEIHVADDFEICLRTFLATRMVHVRRFGYIQYHSPSGSNTQRRRNEEIQRLVRLFAARYEDAVHQRFVALGVDDFLYRRGRLDWSLPDPDPAPSANYVFP